MPKIDFGGTKENIVTRSEFPLKKAQQILKKEVVAIIGYGVQGPAQSLNMRDNGINVIIGQDPRFKGDWDRAAKDGFKPGKTLFDIEEACQKATIIMMLVNDGALKVVFPRVKPHLTAGKALYFSHGFGWVYRKLTGVSAPRNVDVILVAPKGSGTSVRRNFLAGVGINSSFGVAQDATGKAMDRTLAIGIAVGSGYLFPTTFEDEVTSDLVGERGVLMGALAGIMEAQYDVLRKNGHSPSEAFNETVEELTQSLIRLVDENGMDWMYSNCSATAQRGALDWKPRFKKAVHARFQRPLQGREEPERSQARHPGLRRRRLQEEARCRTRRHGHVRNVARRCGRPLPAPSREGQEQHHGHQGTRQKLDLHRPHARRVSPAGFFRPRCVYSRPEPQNCQKHRKQAYLNDFWPVFKLQRLQKCRFNHFLPFFAALCRPPCHPWYNRSLRPFRLRAHLRSGEGVLRWSGNHAAAGVGRRAAPSGWGTIMPDVRTPTARLPARLWRVPAKNALPLPSLRFFIEAKAQKADSRTSVPCD